MLTQADRSRLKASEPEPDLKKDGENQLKDKKTNEEILHMVQEDTQYGKHKWTDHMLWHDRILCDIVEERVLGNSTRGRETSGRQEHLENNAR